MSSPTTLANKKLWQALLETKPLLAIEALDEGALPDVKRGRQTPFECAAKYPELFPVLGHLLYSGVDIHGALRVLSQYAETGSSHAVDLIDFALRAGFPASQGLLASAIGSMNEKLIRLILDGGAKIRCMEDDSLSNSNRSPLCFWPEPSHPAWLVNTFLDAKISGIKKEMSVASIALSSPSIFEGIITRPDWLERHASRMLGWAFRHDKHEEALRLIKAMPHVPTLREQGWVMSLFLENPFPEWRLFQKIMDDRGWIAQEVWESEEKTRPLLLDAVSKTHRQHTGRPVNPSVERDIAVLDWLISRGASPDASMETKGFNGAVGLPHLLIRRHKSCPEAAQAMLKYALKVCSGAPGTSCLVGAIIEHGATVEAIQSQLSCLAIPVEAKSQAFLSLVNRRKDLSIKCGAAKFEELCLRLAREYDLDLQGGVGLDALTRLDHPELTRNLIALQQARVLELDTAPAKSSSLSSLRL